MHTTLKALALCAVALSLPVAAAAQDRAPETTFSPLSGVYACKVITSETDRLACYDAAVGLLQEKEEKKEFVAIDSAAAKTLKREAFGFTLPSLPKLGLFSNKDGAKKAEKDDNTVDLAVKSVSKRHSGIIIVMENGQIWRGTGGRLNYIPNGDLTARISRGAIGSYKLSLSNGKDRVRGLNVKRVE